MSGNKSWKDRFGCNAVDQTAQECLLRIEFGATFQPREKFVPRASGIFEKSVISFAPNIFGRPNPVPDFGSWVTDPIHG
jgi:hypothetical protein